jgi:prolyl oligopeptidase
MLLTTAPPHSPVEPVTEILHGVPITDPYRWLENQESPQTREWLAEQTQYARTYLDAIPCRERIRERIRELLDVETYDSIHKTGNSYVFRKRGCGQEQPCIVLREGASGPDQILIDPADRGTGENTAVRPIRISSDGQLMLYEVKEGGERMGTFELLDIKYRKTLPDILPRGYLRGFSFAPDSRSFYYAHEAVAAKRPHYKAAYRHIIGTNFKDDREVFFAGENERLRLHVIPGEHHLGFLVVWFLDKAYTSFWLWPLDTEEPAQRLITNVEYSFGPILFGKRVLAITNRNAASSRIVELRLRHDQEPEFVDVVPETDSPIRSWLVTKDRLYVSYVRGSKTRIQIFDGSGAHLGELPINENDTIRLIGHSPGGDEVFYEEESFIKPIQIYRCSPREGEATRWEERLVPFDPRRYRYLRTCFSTKDGVSIPIFLVGRHEVLEKGHQPTIMTSYGGFGVPMTPQFSIFVTFLIERGCLFALPCIRGGSEFGLAWHNAAKRRNRLVAVNDFLAASDWLIAAGHTDPERLAIFGGSNSGLLIGAALTQRPGLFRAAVCMVPLLDMLRYHLFDGAHISRDELGTADDADDFSALMTYSPYHHVRDGVAYPATMIVSGDKDQNCNPLHARKMTARLQAANVSDRPILLDYSSSRGHSPVLPLSQRVEALTDRMAFLCDQLQLAM